MWTKGVFHQALLFVCMFSLYKYSVLCLWSYETVLGYECSNKQSNALIESRYLLYTLQWNQPTNVLQDTFSFVSLWISSKQLQEKHRRLNWYFDTLFELTIRIDAVEQHSRWTPVDMTVICSEFGRDPKQDPSSLQAVTKGNACSSKRIHRNWLETGGEID